MQVLVRQERPGDEAEVSRVIAAAFGDESVAGFVYPGFFAPPGVEPDA
ncbi:MAG TPA: hypothetical protein VM204_02235 [Gaiellaceae bacterium]|nr:hypothetical protein [Gaiellaceae bacterium]